MKLPTTYFIVTECKNVQDSSGRCVQSSNPIEHGTERYSALSGPVRDYMFKTVGTENSWNRSRRQ